MNDLSDVDFVNIWQSCSSRIEVAKKSGLSMTGVGARVTRLRLAGVKLKSFNRGRKKKEINVEQLNDLIKQMEK